MILNESIHVAPSLGFGKGIPVLEAGAVDLDTAAFLGFHSKCCAGICGNKAKNWNKSDSLPSVRFL